MQKRPVAVTLKIQTYFVAHEKLIISSCFEKYV